VGRRGVFPAGDAAATRRRLRILALYTVVALFLVAVAIPLQYRRQWITVGFAVEAAFAWWLYRRLAHPGVKYTGALLFLIAGVRLLLNPAVLRYAPAGPPILNWILYTYGIAAVACFAGAQFLKPSRRRGSSKASASSSAAAGGDSPTARRSSGS